MAIDYNNLKQTLSKLLEDKKRERQDEDNTRKMRNEEDRNSLIGSIGSDLVEALKPTLEDLARNSKISSDELRDAIKSSIDVKVPEIRTDELREAITDAVISSIKSISIPQPKVTVNVPPIKIPDIIVPENKLEWPLGMEVGLRGVNLKNPLPVILTDNDGKPYIAGSLGGRGGGGGMILKDEQGRIATIRDLSANDALNVAIVDGSGNQITTFGGGTQYAEGDTAATPTGTVAMWKDNSGVIRPVSSTYAFPVEIYTQTGDSVMDDTNDAVRVNIVTGAAGNSQYGDGDARGTATGIIGMVDDGTSIQSRHGTSYGVASVQIAGFDGSLIGITSNALDVNIASGSTSGTQYNDGATPDQAGGIGTVSMIWDGGSTQSRSGTSYGVGHVLLTGFDGSLIATTATVGDIASDVADTESNPIKIGGIARTANPTAVAAGDRVAMSMDDLGRQLMRPMQVRDLIATAYATLSNGTETTLLTAGGAGVFHDLVYVMASNTSTNAIRVDIRDVTAGSIVLTIEVPGGGTAGVALPVPFPQGSVNNNWTADMLDDSNTTVLVSGLFTKEV